MQPGKTELVRRIGGFELFSQVPQKLIKEIALIATVSNYRRGQFIWHSGDKVRDIYLLESGFVKVARRDRTGASKTYGLYGPGDTIGVFAMCAGMTHSIDAIALNEGVTTIGIDAMEFSKLTNNSMLLGANLRIQLTRFTEALINKIEVVSAVNIEQRVAVLMTQLIDHYGVDREKTRARLPFSFTLEQLSEIIDARIETLVRVFSKWKRAGWLTTDSGGYDFKRMDKVHELLSG